VSQVDALVMALSIHRLAEDVESLRQCHPQPGIREKSQKRRRVEDLRASFGWLGEPSTPQDQLTPGPGHYS